MSIETECLDDYEWELANDEIGVGLDDIGGDGRRAMKLEGPALVDWVRRALSHLFAPGVTPSDGRFVTEDDPHGLAHFGADRPDELVEGVIAAWVADGMSDLEWQDWRLNTAENRATLDALAARAPWAPRGPASDSGDGHPLGTCAVETVMYPRYMLSHDARRRRGGVTRTIYHIRHGQTDWNAAGKLQGSQDIPLNARGRAQADANGRALAEHFATIGRDPASLAFVASPLGRTRETMERVRTGLGLDPAGYTIVPDLREVSFGRFEGMSYADIEAHAPAAMAAIRRDKWSFLPPDGESYVMLAARVRAWVEASSGDVVIVSHGGVFRALRAVIEAIDDHDLAHLFVPQDRIFQWRDRHGAWL